MSSICSQCGKEDYCLPMGADAAKICYDCFSHNQADPQKATVPKEDPKAAIRAAFEGFTEFARENGIDINDITGEKLANMLSVAIVNLVGRTMQFGIKVRKIEFEELGRKGRSVFEAMRIEGSYNEFDEKFLPILREMANEAAIADAGAVPDHIRAAVQAQGDSIGKFNA